MECKFKDITSLSSENPRKYPVPKEEELAKVKSGYVVKLIIENNYNKKIAAALKEDDRVLVNVISCRNDEIMGRICYCSEEGFIGSIIKFTYRNILFVYKDMSKVIDMEKHATISHRALEHKELNWVFKSTPLNYKDSGWQLFYGNEDPEDMADASNSQKISMKEVLKNEPLLEYVFTEKMENAEYSSRLNKFIVI